jgi:hypothetical protein
MNKRRASTLWVAIAVVGVYLGSAGATWANNRWGCWKYQNASINVYNGASQAWYRHYQKKIWSHSRAWDPYTDLVLTQVSSPGKTDHINCYADFYGNNGWLGIAEILTYSGCIIKEGRTRCNKTYLNNGGYSKKNKRHVACQEVGHLFGLDHQYANTCMNDSILTKPRPNAHDRNMVNGIY